ncbi:MAG TPA: ankyrin repeat domain-containing protein [Polyangiaceae bacterium]|nr:ankyrin repeat domain-containing protein [Polyangiaceae bacterium]
MYLRALPAQPQLEPYEQQAEELLRLLRSSADAAWQRLKAQHPRAGQLATGSEVSFADAQVVIAREHGFESWSAFARLVEELARASGPEHRFESAVDAVVSGDLARLASLLEGDPELVRARSSRLHGATLLHYVAANGVEDFRQKCAPNAVEVARALIAAGADVNTPSTNMYGQPASVLDMLVSSTHPAAAGVQGKLAELLLDHGARHDGAALGALAFGYPETAALIARRTGIDNVVVAAGLGRLDLVQGWVDADGKLASGARLERVPGVPELALEPKAQLEQALIAAARCDHADVVEFLLGRGVDGSARGSEGLSALHWAALFGHLATLRVLIAHRAPLEAHNVYGGTVLGTVVWALAHRTTAPGVDHVPIVRALLEAGADASAAGRATGNATIDELLSRHRTPGP